MKHAADPREAKTVLTNVRVYFWNVNKISTAIYRPIWRRKDRSSQAQFGILCVLCDVGCFCWRMIDGNGKSAWFNVLRAA